MTRHILSIADLPIEGQRVFIRVDFNVPLTPARGVADDSRIRASLPTIQHALSRGAKVVLASHLGRPKGVDPALSLEPVGARLAELLGVDVVLSDEAVGDGASKVVSDLREGQLVLLENLRFDPGEEANDEGFARKLAAHADIYVNDAFGAAHRAHASTVGMVSFMRLKGAGLLMLSEVKFLSKLLGSVEHPFLAVVGGAKVSDKIAVLGSLLGRVDGFAIGGAMANTFIKAQGGEVGRSRVEEDKLQTARDFLRRAEARKVEVLLPTDVVAATGLDATSGKVVPANAVPAELMALDLGPESRARFAVRIGTAKTVFWNGPMGVFEKKPFAAGTLAIAEAVASVRGLSVVGGGDSVAAVQQAGVGARIGHISTGGGASLEFLEGQELPGLRALEVES